MLGNGYREDALGAMTPGKVGSAALLITMGIATGIGLFYAYAPTQRKQRQRVADARENLRKVRESCRRKVEEAAENVAAIRRGDVGTDTRRSPRSPYEFDTDPDELEGWR